jgi:hypothetical protein
MHHLILLNKQHLEPTYKHFHMLKKIKISFNLYYYLHLTHGFMSKGILNRKREQFLISQEQRTIRAEELI